MKLLRYALLMFFGFALSGCFEIHQGYQDIDAYMADVKTRPMGNIEPLPQFRPYEAFTYQASAMRSPFKQPVKVALSSDQLNSNIKPDASRVKQYLEKFEMDSFRLVGSISNDEGFWGLVRGSDGVHRVKVGDYIGRNHGRITYIDEQELRVTEIVPAGPKYWIERPRILPLDIGSQ
ncbi:pilus assembly protein PilP [uncultured Endozoicomonas sp.]|uniref:pilus assembly protein PilP n=1 Tax=uncultured Endozoicomonas sp. TaxID=432652 RepID=UPI00261B1B33|nr:pilus assembly protein PilP [uncultured Endozoicomonas sp.]